MADIKGSVKEADVCLIIDDSYPFEYSETSNWIKELLVAHPNTTFSLVCLHAGNANENNYSMRYAPPVNVLSVDEVEPKVTRNGTLFLHHKELKTMVSALYSLLKCILTDTAKYSDFSALYTLFRTYESKFNREWLLSNEMWDCINSLYKELTSDVSFLDFYKTVISLTETLFSLLTYHLPKAGFYHCMSAGNLGILALNAKLSNKCSVFVSEYNIQAIDRKVDILTSDMFIPFKISSELISTANEKISLGNILENILSSFMKLTYEVADGISALYAGNRELQITFGADPSKCMIIPASIDYDKYSSLPMIPLEQRSLTVTLAGDVDPDNDIKTFLYAANSVLKYVPYVHFLIVGSTEKDRTYYKECCDIVSEYNLQDNVLFTGIMSMEEILRKTDLMVSTALHETMIHALLKGGAAGIPFVACNIGAISLLADGRDDDENDKKLGKASVVTDIMNPDETAKGIVKLLLNYNLRCSMGKILSQRVKAGYSRPLIARVYSDIYRKEAV